MASNASSPAPFSILIVDDDRLVRSALARTLSRIENVEIHEFGDGLAALAAAAEKTFRVAVLDLQMPVIDGAELGARLREVQPRLPLIFVSANTTSALAERARSLGVEAIVAKPWSVKDLVELVSRLCK